MNRKIYFTKYSKNIYLISRQRIVLFKGIFYYFTDELLDFYFFIFVHLSTTINTKISEIKIISFNETKKTFNHT